ncbi:MAG: helix-turn-helix transcriptional regulator [Patescibacteria group bacterium]|nr:helix-turn-helix transcriptional regulator [Patescibacteria group bacterium]
MAKKRYASVLEMARDVVDDPNFTEDLDRHLSERQLVTQLMAIRAAKGQTQRDIAERIGVSQGTVSKLEMSADTDLSFGAILGYARALELDVEITLIGQNVTLVDRVKHHAFCIKRLTDRMAHLGKKDVRIADGVGKFLKEAAYNLVRLVSSSAALLPAEPRHSRQSVAVNVFGVDEEEESDAALSHETCEVG